MEGMYVVFKISVNSGMTVARRLRCLAFNLARNLGLSPTIPPCRSYCTDCLLNACQRLDRWLSTYFALLGVWQSAGHACEFLHG